MPNRDTFLLILLTILGAVSVSAQPLFSLHRALQTAKSNNPFLKKDQFNINIAESDIVTAQLRPNPILNNQSLQLVKSSVYPNDSKWSNASNRQVWWQLTKPVQLPKQRQYKIEIATQNAQVAQKSYIEAERNLFQATAVKWLDVWAQRKQLDILQSAKKNIDTLVTINKLRLKSEVISETDFVRTELLANQYLLQIKSAEREYQNALNELKLLIGTQDEIQIDTTDQFSYSFPDSFNELLQQALSARSDLDVLESTIDATKTNIKLQKALALPQPELGIIYNPQNTMPYLGIYGTVDLPFFSRNQGEIKKSYFFKQQAEQYLDAARRQVQTELTNAYTTYQTQRQNVQDFTKVLQQSQDILNKVRYAYLRGGTSIIDFLEAQRSWLDTQQQYYDTLRQFRSSYIQLLYTSGLIHQLAQ
ncbi:TolC family protein [Runella salmonicolor]|uniref:TolC family protein n=1 Tax=Runella salmonicolor TaxID=2950278 RepID=A0ABT1FX61_9BACT|nr:TolC family protein [Runella salmonicolor]MCP1386355.1 TolC family protein [Runella salmonicolor]